MKKSSLSFKTRTVYSRVNGPDTRSFCFQAFTNHKFFGISPLWQIGIADQSLVQEPQKCCYPAPVVSDLISVQCQTHNCWEMHSCLQHSENCLHCSDNTWNAEPRISDLITTKSMQVATDTSLVLGQAAFLPNHYREKKLSTDIIK